MGLKFRHGSLSFFAQCRKRSSSSKLDGSSVAGPANSMRFMPRRKVELASLIGFPCGAGQRNVAWNLNKFRALATLPGDLVLNCQKSRNNDSSWSPVVKALSEGNTTGASNILQKLGRTKHTLRDNDFIDILRYCEKSSNALFAMETWRFIDERKITINSHLCMLMARALCKGGYLEEAFNMLQYLGENHGVYFLEVYNYFLRIAIKNNNVIYAGKCLDLMERWLVGKNEHTYLALLKLAVLRKNKAAVHEIWEDYIKHYPANIYLVKYFVLSFMDLGDLESACKILQFLVTCSVNGAAFGVKNINGRFCFPKFDVPIPLKNELCFEKWDPKEGNYYNEKTDGFGGGMGTTSILGQSNITPRVVSPIANILRKTFDALLKASADIRNCSLAEKLVLQMTNIGLEPSPRTYDGLLRAVVYEKDFVYGMQLLETMGKRNLEPLKSTLAVLSKSCSAALELDMAEALLDRLAECPYPFPYNALLKACKTKDDLERAIRVFAKMKKAKCKPDIKTYEQLFSLFGNYNPPYERGSLLSQAAVAKRIKAIEADMANNDVYHSSISMRNLLRALGQEGMIKQLLQYLRVAEDDFSRKNMQLETDIYTNTLFALVAARESLRALEMFRTMRKCGFPLNYATYNTMIDCCCHIGSFRHATALLSLMLRDGYPPMTTIYTALIKIALDDKNVVEVLHLLHLACSEGDKIDTRLFNTVMKKASEWGELDLLEHVIEQMQRANTGPDASTCSYVFTAYADGGYVRTAVEALHVLSIRMLTQGGDLPSEKRAQYEEFIFDEDPEVEFQMDNLFKHDQDHIAFALLNLRWVAILGLIDSVNWAPDQSSWAQRLSVNYKDTALNL